MNSRHCPILVRSSALLAFGLLLASPASTWSQSIVATVPVGIGPTAMGINTVTNKVYVAGGGSVTVIDGGTRTPTILQTPPQFGSAAGPNSVAVNEVTNKIYIAYYAGVLLIDGATNATTAVLDPNAYPFAAAVNPITNKIYICNSGLDANNILRSNVTVIDGNTNAVATVTTVTDPSGCYSVAVNPVTNKIYVVNGSSVTVIDGATNRATTIKSPFGSNQPAYTAASIIAVNQSTDKIYVVSINGITVIDGATNATTTITNPSFGQASWSGVAVNPTTDKIYVTTNGITVIDGATNSLVAVPSPIGEATVMAVVNQKTNTVYAVDLGPMNPSNNDNPASITVLDGMTNATHTIIDPHADNALVVAVNPVINQIYVLSSKSLNPQSNVGNVTIIDGNVAPTTHALGVFVFLAPGGQGEITSTPAGINCAGFNACSSSAASFASGTVVHLNATATTGYAFSWTGACTGSGPCDLTMDSDMFVTANMSSSSSSGGGSSGGNGGGSGGGGIEVLTLGALLSCLVRRAHDSFPRRKAP